MGIQWRRGGAGHEGGAPQWAEIEQAEHMQVVFGGRRQEEQSPSLRTCKQFLRYGHMTVVKNHD